MKVLEKTEIKIIGAQLGIFAKPHMAQASGMTTPN
jgi:hypothetical protein